jgi:hypothetical protein
MALVACKECCKKISDLADKCPYCGHPDPIPKVNETYDLRLDGKIYKRYIARIARDNNRILDSCHNCGDNYWAYMAHRHESELRRKNNRRNLRFFVKCMSCGEVWDASLALYGYIDERKAGKLLDGRIYDDGLDE